MLVVQSAVIVTHKPQLARMKGRRAMTGVSIAWVLYWKA